MRFSSLLATCVVFSLISFAIGADNKEHADVSSGMQAAEEHVSVTQRYPLLGAPTLKETPKIDGTVEAREWSGAARASRFVDYTKGLAVKEKTDIFVGYTPTHLYIAFQFERPTAAGPVTLQDKFEILIDDKHAHNRYYNVGFSMEKAEWDGIGPNVDKEAWKPVWDYKARATDWGWEGEIAIAWDQFIGMTSAPAPGTIWGVDFVRNERTPVDRLACWAFRGSNWHATKNFGHLLFTGRPVAIRTEGLGWMPETKQAGVKVLVSNFSDQPVMLDSTIDIRRTDQPVTMEYYPQIDSAMGENLPAMIGSPLKKEVEVALKGYPVLKEAKEQIVVPANGNKLIQLAEADDPGKYVVSFQLTEGGKPVAGATLPVVISVPLAINLHSYLLSAKTLAYEVDLRRVSEKVGEGSSLALIVQDPSGKTVAEDKKPIPQAAQEITGDVHFEPAFETTYDVTAKILDANGNVAATNQEHVRVPAKAPWMGNQLGLKKFVPDPFKPLEATDRQVKVLTSTITWPEGALLPDFKVFDREPLAAPISLTIKDASGAELPIKITDFKTKEKDIEKVTFTFKGTAGDKAAVAGTVSVEFDGFVWYSMNLAPGSAPLELSSAILQFTLKPEYANYCTIGAAEAGTVYSGHIPPEGIKSRFSFSFWLGGIDGGVQWVAQNHRNWSNANKKEVVGLTRDDKAGKITINFIDKPTTIAKPIDWEFGFIPTPSRVKPTKWGEYAFFQTGGIITPPKDKPDIELQKTDPNAYHKTSRYYNYFTGPGWTRDKENISGVIYHGYWQELFGYPGTYDPKRQQQLKESVSWMHSEGIQVILYAGWGVNTEAPEFKDYGMEMIALPLYNSGYSTFRQCPTTLWQDWFVYKMAELIRDYDIDGIFIDSVTSPINTQNYTPGMRWIDADGKLQGSYPILASRQWLMRLYKLWHGEMKQDGVIYNHNSPPAVMPIENFADVRCPSEFAQTHKGEFDRKFLDYFIAKNAGEEFGVYVELTNKDWMGDWAVKKTPQIYALCLPLNVSIKAVNLYDAFRDKGSYEANQQMMQWIWQAYTWADRSTAEYLPWWRNEKYITATPNDEQVLTALWLHKGKKTLLCVSNLKNEARKIDVELKLAELGMTGITAEDAITGEKVETTGGKMQLEVAPERFRLIKVTAQ